MSAIYLPANTITIEHILPQTPSDRSQWKEDFTDVEREMWTDKLGNLILLFRRKNSSQENAVYVDKKKCYFQNRINPFLNSIAVIIANDKWTMRELQTNQDR
ncbi:HNH endonuclease family protein [Selenomonas ruminantium]|uniref:HNH endonuclease family protein n=1 Tax=Selenomonas ruminantium TaxID=971 RepID=UPI0026F167A4|nr:HNH endonuclease family protein [Selenomonas ruminantium]